MKITDSLKNSVYIAYIVYIYIVYILFTLYQVFQILFKISSLNRFFRGYAKNA